MHTLALLLLKAQEEGGHGGVEAPNPIFPATNEIIWGALSFTLLFFMMKKFAYPQIKKGLDARAEKISNSIDEAERTRSEAQGILEEYRSQLADARGEAARIIEEARSAADKLRQDLRKQAESEVAEERKRARDDIRAEADRVKASLRSEMAGLAIAAAEQVVQKSLDRETNLALIENYINEVGSSK